MEKELVVFWRLRDGTRCVVLHDAPGGWQLRVIRGGDAPLLTERFLDPHALLARALELRAAFEWQAA
jgi:hypothetical protein